MSKFHKGRWKVTVKAYIAIDDPQTLQDLILCRIMKDEAGEEVVSADDKDFEVLDYPDDWLDFEEIIE